MMQEVPGLTDSHVETLSYFVSMPFASARDVAVIFAHKNENRVGRARDFLESRGLLSSMLHRTPWATADTKRVFVMPDGIAIYEDSIDWPAGKAYNRFFLPVTRQWQRILYRHIDTVTLAYDIFREIARLRPDQTPLRPFISRTGSFDAAAFHFKDGVEVASYGVMHKGNSVLLSDFVGRLVAVADGIGPLNQYNANDASHRGPQVIFCIVRTEQEKVWLLQDIPRESLARITPVVATERDLSTWTTGTGDRVSLADIVRSEHPETNFQLRWPTEYAHRNPPLHLNRMPPLYTPRQRRIMEVVHDWALTTTAQVAAVLGTPRTGSFSRDVRTLCEDDVLRQIQRSDWPGRHLQLPNKGLSFNAARDRADPRELISKHGDGGTETAQLFREAEHAFGVNEVVSRVCRELPYTPQVLSARAARRGYKIWRRIRRAPDERIGDTRWVSPDAVILLHGPEYQTTSLLLEWETQSSRGGQHLTDKIMVWLNSHFDAYELYLGNQQVLFVVPTQAAARTLRRRARDLMLERGQTELTQDPELKILVTSKTELDKADSVLRSPIWTWTTHPDAPRIALM